MAGCRLAWGGPKAATQPNYRRHLPITDVCRTWMQALTGAGHRLSTGLEQRRPQALQSLAGSL